MLAVVRADAVAVSLHLVRADGSTTHASNEEEVRVGATVSIRARLANRTEAPLASLLRFRPRLAGVDEVAMAATATATAGTAAAAAARQLDITRLVAWSAQLVRSVPLPRLGEETRAEELGLTFLSAGAWEVEVDVIAGADATADAAADVAADADAVTADDAKRMDDSQEHAWLGGSVVRLRVVD